jgi:hypothetical protein
MATRYSARLREKEVKKFKEIINQLKDLCDIFSNPQNYTKLTKKDRAKHIRSIYILMLKNIRLFHKHFPAEKLDIMFKTLTLRGYHLIHCGNSKTIQKMIEKPILDLVTYIHNYKQTMSRLSYKLNTKMNEDIHYTIISFIS